MAKQKYIYSDVKSTLNKTPNGDVEVEYDGNAVIQSIKNILSTVSGERVRNPIGSVLLRYLFEPISEDTADDIRSELLSTIKKHEPRVRTIRVTVKPDPDNHIYIVSMSLTVDKFVQPLRYQTRLRSME